MAATASTDTAPAPLAPEQENLDVGGEDDVEHLIMQGEADEACTAACHCPAFRSPFKFMLLLNSLVGAAMLIIMGAILRDNAGIIMLEIGTMLLILAAMLVFYLFPPDNPVRMCIRRSRLLVCYNRKWCPVCTRRVVKFLPALAMPLGAVTALIAVILSSIIMNDPEERRRPSMVRATISMWIIAFIALFPLGGARRLRVWFAEPDE